MTEIVLRGRDDWSMGISECPKMGEDRPYWLVFEIKSPLGDDLTISLTETECRLLANNLSELMDRLESEDYRKSRPIDPFARMNEKLGEELAKKFELAQDGPSDD